MQIAENAQKTPLSTTRVYHLEFWKILDVRVHFPFTPYLVGTYIAHVQTKAGISDVKFVVVSI